MKGDGGKRVTAAVFPMLLFGLVDVRMGKQDTENGAKNSLSSAGQN